MALWRSQRSDHPAVPPPVKPSSAKTSSRSRRIQPLIRRLQIADASAVARIFEGPRVLRGTLQVPFPSADQWQRRLTADLESGVISLVATVQGEIVGLVGLHTHPGIPRRQHSAELGLSVQDDWQGRGIGTALLRAALDLADHWLQLRRISLNVFTDNEPAIRLYRRHGFETEGTQRNFAFREGAYVDALLMARLR